ncbi:hypothetical protein SCHPADRAFT_886400 [Schizopora paradoxa]|uniref:Uncharacterized protein n=1 Tax=Schizopora paradoxa TaxID=27342 RepID=A0A0H2SM19_9AGAM|nr:hypothetical protein SCHPADRAFT_886400 [Schizopora paradoxa]
MSSDKQIENEDGFKDSYTLNYESIKEQCLILSDRTTTKACIRYSTEITLGDNINDVYSNEEDSKGLCYCTTFTVPCPIPVPGCDDPYEHAATFKWWPNDSTRKPVAWLKPDDTTMMEDLVPSRLRIPDDITREEGDRILQIGQEIMFYIKRRGEGASLEYDVFYIHEDIRLIRYAIISKKSDSYERLQTRISDKGFNNRMVEGHLKLKRVDDLLRPAHFDDSLNGVWYCDTVLFRPTVLVTRHNGRELELIETCHKSQASSGAFRAR